MIVNNFLDDNLPPWKACEAWEVYTGWIEENYHIRCISASVSFFKFVDTPLFIFYPDCDMLFKYLKYKDERSGDIIYWKTYAA